MRKFLLPCLFGLLVFVFAYWALVVLSDELEAGSAEHIRYQEEPVPMYVQPERVGA